MTEPGFKLRQFDFEFTLLVTKLPLHAMVFLLMAPNNIPMLLFVFLTLQAIRRQKRRINQAREDEKRLTLFRLIPSKFSFSWLFFDNTNYCRRLQFYSSYWTSPRDFYKTPISTHCPFMAWDITGTRQQVPSRSKQGTIFISFAAHTEKHTHKVSSSALGKNLLKLSKKVEKLGLCTSAKSRCTLWAQG